MKKSFVSALLGTMLIVTCVMSFGMTEEVEAHSTQWTWCGDLNDSRCCIVWGHDCQPDINLDELTQAP